MKKILFCLLMAFSMVATGCNSSDTEKETVVALETTAGTIRLKLYNDTPGHRDNFLQNVRDGLYDGVIFHRVIRNFMIQTGNPSTRPGEVIDTTKQDPTIPAEIVYPKYYHKRGSVAAARESDDKNPNRESNKFQFYIVTGKHYSDAGLSEIESTAYQNKVDRINQELTAKHAEQLEALRQQRDRKGVAKMLDSLLYEAQNFVADNPPAPLTQAQKRAYKSRGGSPWLDGEYTIFGEVIEGMKIVEDIEKIKTGKDDLPLHEIRIIKATVEE
jgi:peptidylprolyl isomerase